MDGGVEGMQVRRKEKCKSVRTEYFNEYTTQRVRIQLNRLIQNTTLMDAMCFWRVLLGANMNNWVGNRKEVHSQIEQ